MPQTQWKAMEKEREKQRGRWGKEEMKRDERDWILGIFLRHLDSALFNANPPQDFSHEPKVPSFLEACLTWFDAFAEAESWSNTYSPASAPLWATPGRTDCVWLWPRHQTSMLLSDSAFSQDHADSFPYDIPTLAVSLISHWSFAT